MIALFKNIFNKKKSRRRQPWILAAMCCVLVLCLETDEAIKQLTTSFCVILNLSTKFKRHEKSVFISTSVQCSGANYNLALDISHLSKGSLFLLLFTILLYFLAPVFRY